MVRKDKIRWLDGMEKEIGKMGVRGWQRIDQNG